MLTPFASGNWIGIVLYSLILILLRVFKKGRNSAPLGDLKFNFLWCAGGAIVLFLFHASHVLIQIFAVLWVSPVIASVFGIFYSRRAPRLPPPEGHQGIPTNMRA